MHTEKDWSDISVVAAVNDREILHRNLVASPAVHSGAMRLMAEEGFRSAGLAYNSGLDACTSPLVVFAHQDVYLPEGWVQRLQAAIRWLDRNDPQWGTLGVYGVDRSGHYAGRAWCTASNRTFGRAVSIPVPAVAYDEIVIVLRRDTGVRFDPDLPGYHLYGTDIVQQCWASGHSAYIFDGPVVHNSGFVNRLPAAYWDSYRYMQRKWADRLPIPTAVAPVTRRGMLYLPVRYWLRATKRRLKGKSRGPQRHPDPAQLARGLGFIDADLVQFA